MATRTADAIIAAASQEASNRSAQAYGRKVSEGMSRAGGIGTNRNIFTPGKVYNYIVNLFDEPVTLKDFKDLKKDIRATHGLYTIQYLPKGNPKRDPRFPYLIGQDLVRIRVTVSGPAHWKRLCERVPELAWLDRNTQIGGIELFSIAKKHPGLVLRFGIDFGRYCSKIERRAEELGVDIDHKPLVLYQWGADAVPDVDGRLNPQKGKGDYALELKEAREGSLSEEEV